MKMQSKLLVLRLTLFFSLLSFFAFAQNEQKGFSFQGYARDLSGGAYSSATITAQFSLYPEGESVEYSEQHTIETDSYGVFSAEIGTITPVDFADIDFSAKKYFMKVEVKIAGEDFVEISNTELLAVPYAKSAERAVTASNAITANNGNPPGVILSFAGASGNMPTGYLACDGSSVLVADYPALYAAIGDAWGGDGGTNFNLPDLRGQFMRGLDQGTGVDPDAADRTAKNAGGNTGDAVGSYQDSEFKNHNHTVSYHPGKIDGWTHHDNGMTNSIDPNYPLNHHKASSYVGGNETRPTNAYVFFMIKY